MFAKNREISEKQHKNTDKSTAPVVSDFDYISQPTPADNINREDSIEYLRGLLTELRNIANQNGLVFLGYLISLAIQESDSLLSTSSMTGSHTQTSKK